jgi:hypothetical protein
MKPDELRALPDRDLLSTRMSLSFPGTLHDMAEAVTRAAQEDKR